MSVSWRRLRKTILIGWCVVSLAILAGACAPEQEGSTDRSGEDEAGQTSASDNTNGDVSQSTVENGTEGGSELAEGSEPREIFTNDNYARLFTDPDSYVGARVDVVGSLLGPPEFQEGQMAFQMYADPENMEWNTIVLAEDSEMTLGADDFVRVLGTVVGSFEGENAFGVSIVAPQIEANDVEVLSAVEALDPAQKTLELSDTQEDQGFSVTLDKLEFGEETTRVYVTVQNDTGYPASFYAFDAKIIQGTRQLDQEDPYEFDLTEPQSELNPGVQTGGVIAFGPVDPSQPFQIQFEWYSENFDITANPIVFEVNGNEVSSPEDALQEGASQEGDESGDVEAAEEAATAYYQAAGLEDWGYTYDHLDSQTQSMFTEEEWFEKNQYYWDLNPTVYDILSVELIEDSDEVVTEVTVRVTGADGSSFIRTTYWVREDGEWLHRFGQEEIDVFTPGVPFE